ncbi:MAG: response regulator transcription factor [Lewinella sp.]
MLRLLFPAKFSAAAVLNAAHQGSFFPPDRAGEVLGLPPYLSPMEKRPVSILIVEDDVLVSLEIERALTSLGYRVAGRTGNGDKALDLLASCQPDVALLDIAIEGTRSGIDLARIIRRDYKLPFLFLTAYSDRDTLARLMDTMPYGYIVKPFSRGDLLAGIELALHKFAAEQRGGFPALPTINQRLNSPLTQREYEVLAALDRGLTYQQVGEELFISLNTVKYFQRLLFSKLEVSSRLEALRLVRAYND